MFNVLKSDYLAARYLAFIALDEDLPESGRYIDSLDYASYGIGSSMLSLAQRASLDLLDKVAVAASEYLGLQGSPSKVYFHKRWFERRRFGDPFIWQPQVEEEILAGNLALVALSEVACDIEQGGFLHDKRAMRHSSTHRFTVLHDLGDGPWSESRSVDHYPQAHFIAQLLETLQLARAVLFYFAQLVEVHERRTFSDTPAVPLVAPDHDWIRGRADSECSRLVSSKHRADAASAILMKAPERRSCATRQVEQPRGEHGEEECSERAKRGCGRRGGCRAAAC